MSQRPPEPLHLIQFHLDASALSRRNASARVADDPGYRVHAAITSLFGTLAPKPFAIVEPHPDRRARSGARWPSDHRWIEVLGYSASDGATLRDLVADFAAPADRELLRDQIVYSKSMPTFASGRRLGFLVKVCPTVRRRQTWPGRADGIGAEQDAFLHAVGAAPGGAGGAPEAEPADGVRLRESVYGDWLREAFARAGGVRDVTARMVDFRRQSMFRRGRADDNGDRKPRRVELPVARFEGTLTVDDAATFAALLARGLGRHRAFGFGMLLLKPPPG